MDRQFRKLGDLDLIDNFLFQEMLSQEEGVKQVKRKKEVNISYMKSWEIEHMIRKESYEEGCDDGQDRVNQLIMKLDEAGRLADITKAARDKAYQESLFAEFNL